MNHSNKRSEQVKVLIKVKRPKRFKAGSDLSDAVNLVSIEVEEEVNGESESLFVQLSIEESCQT
ncbi:hypothetical protein [Fluviicola sp.]|uniref:hypothetical protein n=1 Tax=Fluviicola sp. TaxID=1917219 RepID=UPI0026333D58|nr:hypothetical protein [Fluviicola sp.]